MAARNMVFDTVRIGDRIVCVALHTAVAPSDAEWDEWNALLERVSHELDWDLARGPNLVLTDGGAPTTAQRTRTTTLIAHGKSMPPVAVVTHSRIARLAVHAFSLFNPSTRAFAPDDLEGIARLLQLSSSDASIVWKLAAALSRRLGTPSAAADRLAG